MSVSTMCYIFDALVQPIMLYCSEIWGAVEFDILEKILLKFCKYVPASCSTTGVLGELGRTPIALDSHLQSFTIFLRLSTHSCPDISQELVPKSFLNRMAIAIRKNVFPINVTDFGEYSENLFNNFITSWLW